MDSQQAFDEARDAYSAQETVTTFGQRLGLGGGDSDLALLHVEAQDAARGFSDASQVGRASAKASAQYRKAAVPMGASTLAGAWGVRTDLFPIAGYDRWRDQWTTKVKGNL
jgi:hypothetical protein